MGDGVVAAIEVPEENLFAWYGNRRPRNELGKVDVGIHEEILVGVASAAVREDGTCGFGAVVETIGDFGQIGCRAHNVRVGFGSGAAVTTWNGVDLCVMARLHFVEPFAIWELLFAITGACVLCIGININKE